MEENQEKIENEALNNEPESSNDTEIDKTQEEKITLEEEKAENSSPLKKYIFIIDDGKKVNRLGDSFPVPVEVIPQAWRLVRNSIEKLGFKSEIRIAKRKDGPVITDNGNFVLDVVLDKEYDIEKLNNSITMIPGVLETGFFIGYADTVCVGTDNGVEILKK